MTRTIIMSFEADESALAKATAALFEDTPFGRCIEIAAGGDNPMCEAQRPEEPTWPPGPVCFRCGKKPEEIPEYIHGAQHYERAISPDDYVRREEGTYNQDNGHFACTECYCAIGMPSLFGRAWRAP